MAKQAVEEGTEVHDVHGVTHGHLERVVGAQLFPGAFQHVGALTQCLIREGTTGAHDDFGNAFGETFNLGIGPGYDCVNVQLSGWDLNFAHKDHHIDRINVRISSVRYDRSTGNVSFRVSGIYRDKNGDDDFTWQVWYTVLALG